VGTDGKQELLQFEEMKTTTYTYPHGKVRSDDTRVLEFSQSSWLPTFPSLCSAPLSRHIE
jgi:hypothetical protein